MNKKTYKLTRQFTASIYAHCPGIGCRLRRGSGAPTFENSKKIVKPVTGKRMKYLIKMVGEEFDWDFYGIPKFIDNRKYILRMENGRLTVERYLS